MWYINRRVRTFNLFSYIRLSKSFSRPYFCFSSPLCLKNTSPCLLHSFSLKGLIFLLSRPILHLSKLSLPMQMQLLLETPESPFQLLSSVFGESKFFSNFVLLQQMYLHRKRYFYKLFNELGRCFFIGKGLCCYPFFLFLEASIPRLLLVRKES